MRRAPIVLVFVSLLAGTATLGQVPDADCFSGKCGGSPGVPECPKGSQEVGWVLYANSKANSTGDCETVVSCTNFGNARTRLEARFFTGFNSIPAGGGPNDALCTAITPDLEPGDTSELATDAGEDFTAAGIFGAADGECPVFEGKGLVCAFGGQAAKVICEAHLSCGDGTVLEQVAFIRRP